MYPGVWPNHPILLHEHADETGQKQTPPASLRAFMKVDTAFPQGEEAMEVVYERCCGLDVHRNMVVACLSIIEAGQRRKEIRTFRSVTKELLSMRRWLLSEGCTHVDMESTGVLWRPVYDRLAGYFELVLVNAAHMKQVPGRKTDVQDADWLANLLQHGLLTPSGCRLVSPNKIYET
jgi:Transposase